MSIREQTQRTFYFLFEQFGFAFLDPTDGADSGMVVVAQSGLIRLRFIQDRADFFLDVGSSKAPEKWIGLYDLLGEMKRKEIISEGYKYANKIGALSGVLRKTFQAVREYVLSSS